MHPTRPTHAIANDVLAAARMAMQDVDSFAFGFESYQEPVLDIGAPADYVDPADFAHIIMTVEWVDSDNYRASLRPPYNDKFMVIIEVNGVKRDLRPLRLTSEGRIIVEGRQPTEEDANYLRRDDVTYSRFNEAFDIVAPAGVDTSTPIPTWIPTPSPAIGPTPTPTPS